MKIIYTLCAVFIVTGALATFGYGMFTLIGAEANSRTSLVRVDPTYAVAWFLVTIILGKVAGVLMKAGED